jgi:hypothetical protein
LPKAWQEKGADLTKTQKYKSDFNRVSSEKNILIQADTAMLSSENHTLDLVDGSTTFFPRFFSRS